MTETAIVIGAGAAQGVGGALSRRFAAGGHHVIIGGRTKEKVEALAADVKANGVQPKGSE